MTLTPELLTSGDLRITIDADDQATLRALRDEDPQDFGSDAVLYAVFESLIASSEYEWVRPEECGALTAAPILGRFGRERPARDGEDLENARVVGAWEDASGVLRTWVEDVERPTASWAPLAAGRPRRAGAVRVPGGLRVSQNPFPALVARFPTGAASAAGARV